MYEINYKILDFYVNNDKYGKLVPIESAETVPFDINRVYYIYDVDSNIRRGFHSHKELNQVLICVSGKVKILLKNPYQEKIINLNCPSKGLYIGPMVWREMYDFSNNAVLLVLADKHYSECDYIRKYDDYLRISKSYFNK